MPPPPERGNRRSAIAPLAALALVLYLVGVYNQLVFLTRECERSFANVDVLLEYPPASERCAYYPGIEKKIPSFGFYIEDQGGRIRIDVAGAVLLSEKRLLFSGDDIHVIGTVMTRQHTKPDGEVVEERVLAKPAVRRSAYQKLMHLIIDRVLAANARGGHSRMLFSDPRTCFWIWDDPRDKPLSGGWDFAVICGVVALLGIWLGVFAACGLAILDREFAQMLAELGRGRAHRRDRGLSDARGGPDGTRGRLLSS